MRFMNGEYRLKKRWLSARMHSWWRYRLKLKRGHLKKEKIYLSATFRAFWKLEWNRYCGRFRGIDFLKLLVELKVFSSRHRENVTSLWIFLKSGIDCRRTFFSFEFSLQCWCLKWNATLVLTECSWFEDFTNNLWVTLRPGGVLASVSRWIARLLDSRPLLYKYRSGAR